MKYISFLLVIILGLLLLYSCGTIYESEFNKGVRDGWNSNVPYEYRI